MKKNYEKAGQSVGNSAGILKTMVPYSISVKLINELNLNN